MVRRLGMVFVFCSMFSASSAYAWDVYQCMYECGQSVGVLKTCRKICGVKTDQAG